MNEHDPLAPEGVLDATGIVRALAEPDRLKVAAALVLGATTRQQVIDATRLPERQVDKALAKLLASGLVTRSSPGGGLTIVTEYIEHASRNIPATPPDATDPSLPVEAARVFRSFVRNGRMTSIPASRSKRMVLLDWLAQRFVPGERYPEREVNRILGSAHPDVAALRRYLVDEGLLTRDAGEYWRTGGTFDVADVADAGPSDAQR